MYTDCIDDIKDCRKCNLCNNQKPLLDNPRDADVFWVGLSAVKVEDTSSTIPLAKDSNTGKLISEIEDLIKSRNFYKTNLVKCLPLKDEKIRYPSKGEMQACYSNLYSEIKILKPKFVFLLGKQVANFISKSQQREILGLSDDFNYKTYKQSNVSFIPIHHPSYILVYKRKRVDEYINGIKKILEIVNEKEYITYD